MSTESNQNQPITAEDIAVIERFAELSFTPEKREMMVKTLSEGPSLFQSLRSVKLDNSIPPALLFQPEGTRTRIHTDSTDLEQKGLNLAERPFSNDDTLSKSAQSMKSADQSSLPFASITELSALIRSQEITSVALTELYLARLKEHNPALHCVVTLTEELAFVQAERADQEIAAGNYRGPLHGIPWGAKDLLATKGYLTTWGAMPFKEQVIDMDATVVQRLEKAGAVMVAKLTLGALAMGDVWFDGKTRSPWNTEEGSSGSSAGSASATGAGLVGFGIGTETSGSIISPCTQCGVTGLRPTFGRVSRHGAMALTWSMDKIGPICRTVSDCALVFDAIYGPDGHDATVVNRPFDLSRAIHETIVLSKLRIGYTKHQFESEYPSQAQDAQTLEVLHSLGAQLIPIELPDYPIDAMTAILTVEAAAAFDELTRNGQDDLLVRQDNRAWPHILRMARLVPAVEYVQANRIRTLLIQEIEKLFSEVDLFVAPSFAEKNIPMVNLTGHPAVVIPNGFGEKGLPTSITFTGRLFDEETVLAVAKQVQEATDFHLQRPPLFS